ncbi:MAG: hypothetical protein CEE43_17615 [Promethearchaeota archaeon Loki_b32]|nr:MAG: hypothetical protein CEE43_17615 [Candidatus Lokiarchaeota archaeon Loki_b32]
MKLLKNKKFYVSILIDFSFLFILYFFVLFIIKKIQSYALKLQDFGLNLKQAESIIQQNASLLDYNLLLNNVELINQVIQKVLILFFLLLVGSFLMYILFQGTQWSFILSNLKNFKKYFWKFSLVSFVSFSLSLLFLYYILLNVRIIFVNYLTGVSFYSPIIKIVLLIVLTEPRAFAIASAALFFSATIMVAIMVFYLHDIL